ncbi:PHP domain-containing protein [bacterium]|nr:PHP domain-containing protein [bacterium]
MRRPPREFEQGGRLYEAVGVTHMHTLYSDGTGTIPEIARFADELGLQWIAVTDHHHLEAKKRGEEGFHGNVRVIVGSELGWEDGPNHYIAYDIDRVPDDQSEPQNYVRIVQEQGGFGAIAHPHEKRDAIDNLPPYPWTAWDVPIDGIELWNQLSQWVEGLTPRNKFHRFLHPLKSLTRPDPETMAVWDRMNRIRPVVGYVGVDAHSLTYPLLGGLIHVKVFHYKVQFRSLRTHLLLEEPLDRKDFDKARQQIHNALRTGRHFGSNFRVGRADGFRFYAMHEEERLLPLDTVESGTMLEFRAWSPLEADLVLLCDGRPVLRTRGRTLTFRTNQPGIWRIEAHRKGKGWIYTNPIRVLPATE